MYAIPNASRVYITFIFLLCAAVLFAPTVANANEYWSVLEKRFIPSNEVPSAVKEMLGHEVKRPTGTNISVSSQPTYTTNPTGGLSATTNNILRDMGKPSNFTSTINNSVNSAKTALKSCVRSPACAGRTLGTGGLLYEGIRGWKDVYDLTLGDDDTIYRTPDTLPSPPRDGTEVYVPEIPPSERTPSYIENASTYDNLSKSRYPSCPSTLGVGSNIRTVVECADNHPDPNFWSVNSCRQIRSGRNLVGYIPSTESTGICQYDTGEPANNKKPVPVSPSELDDLIDEGYEPSSSDAPIILLSGGSPESITISTPSPITLPSTTTTNTSSSGTTTTISNQTINYSVTNNDTSSPSINRAITTISTTYDDAANVIDTSTSTTTDEGVQSEPSSPSSPSAGASFDIEIPAFCTWAKPLCDWLGWTQEGIEGEEPDLINLISEFEPDEGEYVSSIGSGSCPAPMSLNLGIINRTVEVSYQPFCDFLDMIRPLVIAGAWLLSAFMYVGVLRRG